MIGYAGEKLVEFIVSKVLQARFVLKYTVRAILNKLIDMALHSSWVEKLKTNYLDYINPKKISIKNYFIAIFKGVKVTLK